MAPPRARTAAFGPRGPLCGTTSVPGDKSISHRALMLAALAVGRSRIDNLGDGSDVAATVTALRAMGARIERQSDGSWSVAGLGTGGLMEPDHPLDLGNSGTSARLLAGLIASHPIRAVLTGDESLRRRPMERVTAPLAAIGARVDSAPGGRLPLVVEGVAPGLPRTHRLEIPSAQVKSALLLAALNVPGITTVVEPAPTRDHLERLLTRFGAEVEIDGVAIRLRGEAELRPQRLQIAGDPSAGAFLAVAALAVPGSELRVEGLCVNPRRTGLYRVLIEMGADLAFENERDESGEPVADLVVRHSALKGVEVPPEIVPDMIDEFPALFIAAAFARGTTRARGLAELRVKESDRIAAMASGLSAIGVGVEQSGDGLAVTGSGGSPLAGGALIDPALDHRVALAFAVAGLHSREPIGIADMACIDTSFPGFAAALDSLAAR